MQQRKQQGIPLPNNLYDELVVLAKELGVATTLSIL
jgi:LDH2 family malate/lactate/ureidoglycolate dehydrogenase